ncbi:conserved Plasmodium protein, unknown function [Plasmodium gallinaceum]|uniref:Uncharacterized protein n=1 Tax=Plasmodium gallinaceum TaxID=5849 RepID=A0A1J1GW89_PLAGA|nr:conserved Plasmodium protein, unknown function [Plasmodium gallinaceum]CRG96734.1 conserved Plasmodium protein, unknown function [Plasmodium gallinaceum]
MKNDNISEREALLKYKLNNSKKKLDRGWKEKVLAIIKKGNKNDVPQHGVSSHTNTKSTSIFNFGKFKIFGRSKNMYKTKSNNRKESSINSDNAKKNMEKFSLIKQSSCDNKLIINRSIRNNFNKKSTIKIPKNDIKEFKKSLSSIKTKVGTRYLDNDKKNSEHSTKGNYNNSNLNNNSNKLHLMKSFEKNKIVTPFKDSKKNINITEDKPLLKNTVKIEMKNFPKNSINNNNLKRKELIDFNNNENEDYDNDKLNFSSEKTINKLNDEKASLNKTKNEKFLLSKKTNMSMELKKTYSKDLENSNIKINKICCDVNNNKNSNIINNLKLKKNDIVKRANMVVKKQKITTDELLDANNIKNLRRINTKELMSMDVPFKIDPPNLFCEYAYNISPVSPIEERIDMIYSILNNHKNEIITLLKLCIDNNKQCSEILKIILDALIEGEDSIVSKLNKNKPLQDEIIMELEQVLESVNED